ncbi:MotA/TolQ/ExbB proton channel family protein, partial [candidate division KSB1 bacterium]
RTSVMDLVEMYIDGGIFMHPILVLLVLGVALSLWKLFTLISASVNTRKFLIKIKSALQEGGVQQGIDVCANTRGPVAAIFHAGLIRSKRGIEQVEKSIMNAGTVEMAFLERGLIWLSTITAIAPMLGFTGTVYGMIDAFDSIEKANDISPSIVAGGIAQALLTTLFGLVVAMIIQSFNNFFISRIDKLIIDMEESSVDLVDSLIEMESASV